MQSLKVHYRYESKGVERNRMIDRVGNTAEVDEQNSRDGLEVEAIIEVAWEPGQLPLDIQTQSSKEPA